jgi:tRNA nucleotidyltransferase/poly(A) polymerase
VSLEDNLSEAIQNQHVLREISRRSFTGKVFLVGGAIRELLLNKTPADYDLVLTEFGDLRILECMFGVSAFLLGKKPIQTYRLAQKNTSLDITFHKGTIEEDLARRDFTMNAVAYDFKENCIIDPLKGIGDIEAKIIRYPHRQNLEDDTLRMLKAIRHFTALEGFIMDELLIGAIYALKHLINQAAPERIKYEMDQVVISPNAFKGFKMLQTTGLLFELFPDLYALKKLDEEKQFVLETFGHTIDGFKYLTIYGQIYGLDERGLRNTGYALLLHDIGKAHTFSRDDAKNTIHFFYHEKFSCDLATNVMEKLRFSSFDMKAVLKLIENHMRIFLISNGESTEKAVRRLVYKLGDLTPALIVLTLCDMYGSSSGKENDSTVTVRKRCDDVMGAYNEWRKKPLPKLITGNELMAIGFEEGPIIGKILNDIREKQISGEMTLKEEALRHATNQLKKQQEP